MSLRLTFFNYDTAGTFNYTVTNAQFTKCDSILSIIYIFQFMALRGYLSDQQYYTDSDQLHKLDHDELIITFIEKLLSTLIPHPRV